MHDTWLVGVSAGYDSGGGELRSGWGAVSSINYNHGAWTVGGFLQFARGRSADVGIAAERLHVGEFGLSYRSSRKLRWFAAYNHSWLEDQSGYNAGSGLLVFGMRATI
jgi:hypothetical protein